MRFGFKSVYTAHRVCWRVCLSPPDNPALSTCKQLGTQNPLLPISVYQYYAHTGLCCTTDMDDCTHLVTTTALTPDDARVLWCISAHGPAWQTAMLTRSWYPFFSVLFCCILSVPHCGFTTFHRLHNRCFNKHEAACQCRRIYRLDACVARSHCSDPLPDPAAHLTSPVLNTPADVDRRALFAGTTFALDAELCQVCVSTVVLSFVGTAGKRNTLHVDMRNKYVAKTVRYVATEV